MKWLLSLACFLLQHLCIFGAPNTRCEFPAQWRGTWFQSGYNLITINGTRLSHKGQCIAKDNDMFIIYDKNERCYRCVAMYERHHNVIQYKETICRSDQSSDLCNHLDGDAALLSLFRYNASPTTCPFTGPLEFLYMRSDDRKACSVPLSQADACTQDSKLFLRYMACADVAGTESQNFEMECLATWKEGSTQYLVARLNGTGILNDEGRYRCFAYAKNGNTWNLAQSGDASCSGLLSPTEGSKTFNMTQKSESSKCTYPSWLVKPYSWVALDLTASTRLLASQANITILDQHETLYVCHAILKDDIKHNNNNNNNNEVAAAAGTNRFQIVARATRGCTNGFVCIVFHKRDDHVIEMQQSQKWTQQDVDACERGNFDPLATPYTTFITMEPMTRQCPHLGRYNVVFVAKPQTTSTTTTTNDNDLTSSFTLWSSTRNNGDPSVNHENVAEIKAEVLTTTTLPASCHHASVDGLNIGCTKPDVMEFATDCTDKALFKYSCHGTWVENDTAYLVASTELNRYCLVYSALTSTTTSATTTTTSLTTTGNNDPSGKRRELTITGHRASCPRSSQQQTLHSRKHVWQVNLTAYAQCDDVSSASTWRSSGSSLTTHVIFVLGCLVTRYFGR